MDEDVIFPCLITGLVAFIVGLCIGCSCVETTELDNGCIVHDSNIYCIEEASK